MKDVQNMHDPRNIKIDKVGVKNVRYPIVVLDKTKGSQHTVAEISMYVSLPQEYKGTHMSRFVEILHAHKNVLSMKAFPSILREMKKKLNAESAHMEARFPYFIRKDAPVSGTAGYLEYMCGITGHMDSQNKMKNFTVTVSVPVTTLCPCSKEISDYGAHNQRGVVTVAVQFQRFFWIEDLIALIESCSSCEIYSVLKRQDEKFVTEKAFENPKFVEDVAREVAECLRSDANITHFIIEAENFESIHNHSAYAYIESENKGGEV